MSRGVRWRESAVVAALVCVALTGCGTPAPAPTPTPTGFATEDEAFAAAEATYRAYVDALNQVDLSDPATFEDVYAWTTGELNASDRKSLSAWHAEGYVLAGEASVETTQLRQIDPEGNVLLHACYDVSDVSVTDAGQNSLVSPDRVPVQSLEVSLVPEAEAPHHFLVSAINPSGGEEEC